jgi:hypothetical protein
MKMSTKSVKIGPELALLRPLHKNSQACSTQP